MATRSYEFTGALVSTSTLPTVVSASGDDDIPKYSQTARRTSWYDSTADVTALKAISATNRADRQCVFVDSKTAIYAFDSASTATGDDDTVVTPDAGSGRWIKLTSGGSGGIEGRLVEQLHSFVSGIQAGETLSANDAVCLTFKQYQSTHKWFKADANTTSAYNSNDVIGFAKAAASVTNGVYTLTADAAFVASNVIKFRTNGVENQVVYASSSDATLQAIATAIQAHEDVSTATVTVVGGNQTGTDDRVITITGVGGLTVLVDQITVTGGASQPGVVFATTTAAAGANVDVHVFGPLAGFTSLNTGRLHYLSDTAGGVSTTTGTTTVKVGTAISSTQMFVDCGFRNGFTIDQDTLIVRMHGNTGTNAANAVTDTGHFDFTAWAAGTSDSTAFDEGLAGECQFQGRAMFVDGRNTGGTAQNQTRAYNATSWETGLATTNNAKRYAHSSVLNSKLVILGGRTDAAATREVQEWNGTSFTDQGDLLPVEKTSAAAYTQGFLAHVIAGESDVSGTGVATHYAWNGASVTTETVASASGLAVGCGRINSGGTNPDGLHIDANTTTAYEYNGSSFGSGGTVPYTTYYSTSFQGCANIVNGYDPSEGNLWIGGGLTSSTTAQANTAKYTGSSWSAGNSMDQSRGGCNGASI